jgi:hypothetical protein
MTPTKMVVHMSMTPKQKLMTLHGVRGEDAVTDAVTEGAPSDMGSIFADFTGEVRAKRHSICERCADEASKWGALNTSRPPMKLSCTGCRRTVIVTNKRKVPVRTFCVPRCREAYYNSKREPVEKPEKVISIPPPRACEVCSVAMNYCRPTRKFCSPACRQKAHRAAK